MDHFTRIKAYAVAMVLLLTSGGGEAQSQGQSRDQQKELERLRTEIERYRQQIAQKERSEVTSIDMLANIEREVDLTRNLLNTLRGEEEDRKKKIRAIEEDLRANEEALTQLKKSFERRLVNFYKYGRMKDLELLLSAQSLNQAQVWLRFEKIVAENDKRKVLNIIKKRRHTQNQRALLQTELVAKERIIRQKQTESRNLAISVGERKKVLDQVKQDKSLLQRRLQESLEALRRIENYIQRSEQARTEEAGEARPVIDSEFARLKGRMQWPASGTVVSKYGEYKHPQLGTITENLGIDINAEEGTPIYCVARGIVSVITWQRGFGNFIMIDHGEGYYTVYAHLALINVAKGEVIERNQIIGTVGDSGSLTGPALNFQVWKGKAQVNPMEWLGRS